MSRSPLEEFQEGLLWHAEEEDGTVIIGVTESALRKTGSISGIEFAEVGDEFSASDWMGELRGKDATLEITAPCDLTILELNEELVENPALLEDDPTGDAWLVRIRKESE